MTRAKLVYKSGGNTSSAVMNQRKEASNSDDFYPTPLWATRALIEHVLLKEDIPVGEQSVLEPACGYGFMSKPLKEYFKSVTSVDVFDYGQDTMRDFVRDPNTPESFDWVITNPPFNLAAEFVINSLGVARIGTALFTRTAFIEGINRYNGIFSKTPPTFLAQFVERVPIVKGRLDEEAVSATSYCWLVWIKARSADPARLMWIPVCRKALQRPGDYAGPKGPVSPSAVPPVGLLARRMKS